LQYFDDNLFYGIVKICDFKIGIRWNSEQYWWMNIGDKNSY